MWNLPIDAATLEVIAAFGERGIDSVVLKGPALNDWYPADSERTYGDGDVWIAPAAVERASTILAELGFQPVADERGMPTWWAEHAREWIRESDRTNIDLHARLQGATQDPDATWAMLWPRCVEFKLAGKPARRLPTDARALYVTLHAAHHGAAGRGSSAHHLAAALASVDDATWTGALHLARELGALDSFAAGLRLLPEGVELARRIAVPDERGVRSSLLAANAPPVALGIDQVADARGIRRVEILVRKTVPPPGFVRHWWPPAARNRPMLALGYLYRPVWLLKHAPAGYRAWRAARRDASNSS
jgi:Uncharacterised nucleotidyltransferase